MRRGWASWVGGLLLICSGCAFPAASTIYLALMTLAEIPCSDSPDCPPPPDEHAADPAKVLFVASIPAAGVLAFGGLVVIVNGVKRRRSP